MGAYIEIVSLPLKREDRIFVSPAALLAARLTDVNEYIELRVQREEDRLHCYIGVDTFIRAVQLKNLLSDIGIGCKPVSSLGFNSHGLVMVRKVYENFRSVKDGNLERSIVINELMTDKEKIKSLFWTLCHMSNGCGYSVMVKRIKQLDIVTTTFLKDMIDQYGSQKDNIYADLFYATDLFQVCVCAFGNNANELLLMKSELQYVFNGLQFVSDEQTEITSPAIWNYVDTLRMPVKACKSPAILSAFLISEMQMCLDLDGLNMIPEGISINKDSLFPKQRNLPSNEEQRISIGKSENEVEQSIPLKLLRQHMFISGAPGTGKGNLIFLIAKQLYKLKVPTLLIESAKQEQHHLKKSIPELRVWRPKGGEYLLNPFSLPPDVKMGDYRPALLQMLRTCFKGGGEESALDELYTTTLNRCLSKYGYSEQSTDNSVGVTPFGLSEFIMEYIQVLENNGYSDRVRNDMRTAGVTRLRALFDQNPDVFDTVRSVPVTELVSGFNLLQLNSLTTVESKQLFATILLISIGAWLRIRGKESKELELVIIMDESHNLLKGVKNSGNVIYSFADDFENLLLEMRALGVGFIIADQSAKNLPTTISEVCATKVFLGSSLFSGIDIYSDILGADEGTMNNLFLLKAGEGVWNTYGMSSGAFFSSPNVIDSYNINDSFECINSYAEDNKAFFCQTYQECEICLAKGSCKIDDKQKARTVSDIMLSKYRIRLEEAEINLLKAASNEEASENEAQKDRKGRLEDKKEKFRTIYSEIARDIVKTENNGNPFCCAVQFLRKYNREVRKPLDEALVKTLLSYVEQAVNQAERKMDSD